MNNVKFIAHRGLSGKYPENTMVAFDKAWESDCDGIELDIQVTKDGIVLVFHDPNTERTSGEKFIIAETNYSDLRHLNIGFGGRGGGEQFDEHIPALIEVIDAMPSGKLVQIEIKHQITNMQAVLDVLADLRDDIIIQIISFDCVKLQQVKKTLPHLDCLLVIDENVPPISDHLQFAIDNNLTGLDMCKSMATPTFISEIIASGIKVAHWTINDLETAMPLIEQGAEYIVSDFADDLKSQYNKL